mgnify:FL=1
MSRFRRLLYEKGAAMKNINVKRIFLNIGLTLAVIAAIFLFHQLYENFFLVKTTGTVFNMNTEPNFFYTDENGERRNFCSYGVEYTTKHGQTFRDDILGYPDEYKVGDAAEIYYDRREPKYNTYPEDNLFLIIALGVPAALLIYFCRSAFKGYKTEYLDRYKKTVIFSAVTGWIPILYYIWYKFFFTPSGELFSGLGEGLMCLFLFAAVPIVNIIVWIISAAVYCKKQRKLERSVDKNGSA